MKKFLGNLFWRGTDSAGNPNTKSPLYKYGLAGLFAIIAGLGTFVPTYATMWSDDEVETAKEEATTEALKGKVDKTQLTKANEAKEQAEKQLTEAQETIEGLYDEDDLTEAKNTAVEEALEGKVDETELTECEEQKAAEVEARQGLLTQAQCDEANEAKIAEAKSQAVEEAKAQEQKEIAEGLAEPTKLQIMYEGLEQGKSNWHCNSCPDGTHMTVSKGRYVLKAGDMSAICPLPGLMTPGEMKAIECIIIPEGS